MVIIAGSNLDHLFPQSPSVFVVRHMRRTGMTLSASAAVCVLSSTARPTMTLGTSLTMPRRVFFFQL